MKVRCGEERRSLGAWARRGQGSSGVSISSLHGRYLVRVGLLSLATACAVFPASAQEETTVFIESSWNATDYSQCVALAQKNLEAIRILSDNHDRCMSNCVNSDGSCGSMRIQAFYCGTEKMESIYRPCDRYALGVCSARNQANMADQQCREAVQRNREAEQRKKEEEDRQRQQDEAARAYNERVAQAADQVRANMQASRDRQSDAGSSSDSGSSSSSSPGSQTGGYQDSSSSSGTSLRPRYVPAESPAYAAPVQSAPVSGAQVRVAPTDPGTRLAATMPAFDDLLRHEGAGLAKTATLAAVSAWDSALGDSVRQASAVMGGAEHIADWVKFAASSQDPHTLEQGVDRTIFAVGGASQVLLPGVPGFLFRQGLGTLQTTASDLSTRLTTVTQAIETFGAEGPYSTAPINRALDFSSLSVRIGTSMCPWLASSVRVEAAVRETWPGFATFVRGRP